MGSDPPFLMTPKQHRRLAETLRASKALVMQELARQHELIAHAIARSQPYLSGAHEAAQD